MRVGLFSRIFGRRPTQVVARTSGILFRVLFLAFFPFVILAVMILAVPLAAATRAIALRSTTFAAGLAMAPAVMTMMSMIVAAPFASIAMIAMITVTIARRAMMGVEITTARAAGAARTAVRRRAEMTSHMGRRTESAGATWPTRAAMSSGRSPAGTAAALGKPLAHHIHAGLMGLCEFLFADRAILVGVDPLKNLLGRRWPARASFAIALPRFLLVALLAVGPIGRQHRSTSQREHNRQAGDPTMTKQPGHAYPLVKNSAVEPNRVPQAYQDYNSHH